MLRNAGYHDQFVGAHKTSLTSISSPAAFDTPHREAYNQPGVLVL
jgi:hypothetical protein